MLNNAEAEVSVVYKKSAIVQTNSGGNFECVGLVNLFFSEVFRYRNFGYLCANTALETFRLM